VSAWVYTVTRGEYADRVVLAAFDSPTVALAWANRWNLAHLDNISGPGDKAVVTDAVPHNPQEVSE
jgi:hypothetical protein